MICLSLYTTNKKYIAVGIQRQGIICHEAEGYQIVHTCTSLDNVNGQQLEISIEMTSLMDKQYDQLESGQADLDQIISVSQGVPQLLP